MIASPYEAIVYCHHGNNTSWDLGHKNRGRERVEKRHVRWENKAKGNRGRGGKSERIQEGGYRGEEIEEKQKRGKRGETTERKGREGMRRE